MCTRERDREVEAVVCMLCRTTCRRRRCQAGSILAPPAAQPSVCSVDDLLASQPEGPLICPSGGKGVQTSLIGSPWFAWFGDSEHMANQIDQNPNQFLTQPNPFSPDLNQLSQIANRQANKFISSSKPALNSVQTVSKPMLNQARNSKSWSASAYIQQ